MKTEKEKEIDNIFKKGLGDPGGNHEHMDADWDAMEQMLDNRKKRPFIIYWLPILSGVAAMLLLLIGWWLMKPVATHQQNNQLVSVNHNLKPNIAKAPTNATSNKANDTTTPNPQKPNNLALTSNSRTQKFANRANLVKNQPVNNSSAKINSTQPGTEIPGTGDKNDLELTAYNQPAVINPLLISGQNIDPINILPQASSSNSSLNINKAKTKSAYAYRPQFAISVLASSDKNGINSFQQSKPGNNAGVLFSFGLSRKLTISTGAIYSAKQYMTDFADYHTYYQFPTNPVSVLADCKMFDIPLNIDYQVFNKHRNKISVGTGFSSYLMLHENYQFNYAQDATGPSKYNVPNPDKYLFSIVNIQATYTRQINSQVGLTLQPYMKLPISAVGASEVRLQSTGVALGLTWNLNSLSRP